MVVPLVASKVQANAAYAALGAHIREHVLANAPVAVSAIGQVAFEGGHLIVDIGGITQPSAGQRRRRPTLGPIRLAPVTSVSRSHATIKNDR
jgi:hypothetical protein